MPTHTEQLTLKPSRTYPEGPIPAAPRTLPPADEQQLAALQPKCLESQEDEKLPGVTYSTEQTDAVTYPEGGLEAWLVVFGSFMGTIACFGMMNSVGVFQAYISTHQLHQYSQDEIGWIFSVYTFLAFFCGVQIGPIFDAKGPRWLVLAASILLVLSMLLLGFCRQFYQFLIVFGILGGLGTSLMFTPAFSAIGHFFLVGRGTATGIAAAGGSFGGVVFPLMLQQLFPRVGFAWSTRIMALIFFAVCIPANIFIRSRLPPKQGSTVLPDFGIFRNAAFSFTTASYFFLEWGLFMPIAYLTIFVQESGTMSNAFSYQILAIFNAGSCFGRWASGWLADKIGRYNAMLLTMFLCGSSALAMWLPSTGLATSFPASPAIMPLAVVFSVIFGFASGAGISLTPVCVGQLCITEEYGRYYATCYTMVSFSTLTGIPIGGALVSACGGKYWGVAVFTGMSYVLSFACLACARASRVGWAPGKKY
ncbi:MAG: hypothetical protein M1822_000574 [Bathelium mastoideum]|nr:MAG: hypothetical protein M1822_000574 [Bathelium mastoideum]